MSERFLKTVTWAILPVILWMFGGGPSLAEAIAEERSRATVERQRSSASSANLGNVLSDLATTLKAIAAGEDRLDRALELHRQINQRDLQLRHEFDSLEHKIRNRELPDEILRRHRAFVADYERRLSAVERGLTRVAEGSERPDGWLDRIWFDARVWITGDPVRSEAASELLKLLENYRLERVERSFKQADMPFRRLTPEHKSRPRESIQEWHKTLAPNKVSTLQNAMDRAIDAVIPAAYAQHTDLPTPEDLAETIEIQFTPEIAALASELNNNAIEIYNWVRNNVAHSPVWGSIQGAQGCLETRTCSAIDIASLTIALLRSAGIPARYEFGTIDLEAEAFKTWAGDFESARLAAEHVASSGVALRTRLNAAGDVQSVLLEHVWIYAYVDYLPSAGASNIAGDTWVRLDPSFKDFSSSLAQDLSSVIEPVGSSIATAVESVQVNEEVGIATTATISDVIAAIEDNSQAILSFWDANTPESIAQEDIFSQRNIVDLPLTTLSIGGPYRVVLHGFLTPSVPPSLRHTVRISLEQQGANAINYQATLPELVGKTLTLIYSATSEVDASIMAGLWDGVAAGGDLSRIPRTFPASILRVTPYIMLDGKIVAEGRPEPMGQSAAVSVSMTAPSITTESVSAPMTAGESLGIGITPGHISLQQLERARLRISDAVSLIEAGSREVQISRLIEDQLSPTVWYWFAGVDQAARNAANLSDIRFSRFPSLGFHSFRLQVTELFGVPFRAAPIGTVLDIARDLVINTPKQEGEISELDFTLLQGSTNSAYEELIPELLLPTNVNRDASGSAVGLLARAVESDIRILFLDRNTDPTVVTALPYGDDEKQRISNAILAGRAVLVPEQRPSVNAPFSRIEIDPETGGGRYLVDVDYGGYLRVCSQCEGLSGNAQIECLTGGDEFFDVGCLGSLIAFATAGAVAVIAGGAYLLEGLLASYPGLGVQASLLTAQAKTFGIQMAARYPVVTSTGRAIIKVRKGFKFFADAYGCGDFIAETLKAAPDTIEDIKELGAGYALARALIAIWGAKGCVDIIGQSLEVI